MIYVCCQSNTTVSGVMLINSDGIPLKTTMDNTTTVQVGGEEEKQEQEMW